MKTTVKFAAAVTLAAAALVANAAQAQVGRPGRAAPSTNEQRRAPTEQELRSMPAQQIITFQPAPTMSYAAVQGVNAAVMQGWTPVTSGATLGGPSIVTVNNGHRLVVRAGNSVLHDAPIDVVNQSAVLPGSAWRSLGRTATSEPYCVREEYSAGESYFCGYLAAGGAAEVVRVSGYSVGRVWAMGGSNGGGRVTMGSAPYMGYSQGTWNSGFSLLVWDGGTRLFARSYNEQVSPGNVVQETLPAAYQGWKVLQGAYLTPVGCRRDTIASTTICAQGTTNGVRLFSDPWSQAALGGAAPPTFASTQALPTPIGRTAPEVLSTASGTIVVVVRAANGVIYQARKASGGSFGPWISEGGSAREGSGISCTAVNEQPICFIQGADGRIYRKALSTASGL